MHTHEHQTRPLGIAAIAIFLCLATCMAALAGFTLAFPGTVLDKTWAVNPRGHAGLLPFTPAIGYAFFLFSGLLAFTAYGWFQRRRWAWMLAVAIIATQVVGDLVNTIRGDLLRGIFGFVIAGALLWYLTRQQVCQRFRRPDTHSAP